MASDGYVKSQCVVPRSLGSCPRPHPVPLHAGMPLPTPMLPIEQWQAVASISIKSSCTISAKFSYFHFCLKCDRAWAAEGCKTSRDQIRLLARRRLGAHDQRKLRRAILNASVLTGSNLDDAHHVSAHRHHHLRQRGGLQGYCSHPQCLQGKSQASALHRHHSTAPHISRDTVSSAHILRIVNGRGCRASRYGPCMLIGIESWAGFLGHARRDGSLECLQ